MKLFKNAIFSERNFSALLVLLMSLFFAILAIPAHGQLKDPGALINKNLNSIAQQGYNTASTKDLPTVIGGYISVFLGILGVIAIILIIYAGFLWMMARENAEEVKKAKDVMKNAVIGLVVISMAYAITSFVFSSILNSSK